MTTIVISQPMFFPWVGMFEQIKLADIFVYYDDVQFSKGSFTNRVQIKTSSGIKWLTVPLDGVSLGQKISEVQISYKKNWVNSHVDFLMQTYRGAPFVADVYNLVSSVYGPKFATLDLIAIKSMDLIIDYFNLFSAKMVIIKSSSLGIKGSSSQRVLEIIKYFGADNYISGLGGIKYLDHQLFEINGVKVSYMNYQKKPYEQDFGVFNPFVSVLDLVANLGRQGINNICSNAIYWKDFLNESN